MKFIDEAKIYIKSGDGGKGCVSFRREAHVARGGPDGGNGGKGGNLIFKATKSINTLIDFRFKKHFKAQNGESGKGRCRNGKNGKHIILRVPVGTQIMTESNKIIADLDHKNKEITILEGGKGGLGNTSFKSSTNQAPRKSQAGMLGEELNVQLQLKVISDIGIIGFPNAGKSTLLSTISRAKPKIANYPFTTLKPELGVVHIDNKEFVMADIPGLIEGASDGIGLGHKFLKHIERCRAVLHLIDITTPDIHKSYKIIRKELDNYSKTLVKKQEIIALNKIDLIDETQQKELQSKLEKKLKTKVMILSAATQKNIIELKRNLINLVENNTD